MNCLVIGERAAELSCEFTRNYNGIPWTNMESFRQLPAYIGADSFDVRILCDAVFKDISETMDFCRDVLKDYDSKAELFAH